MPRELPVPATEAKADPARAENKAVKRPKRAKAARFEDLPERDSRLSERAKERAAEGLPPHMDPENPEIWTGSICEED